jgi:predicted aspartyl protease
MPQTRCGFDDIPGGASGSVLLMAHGPTLLVNIGFDPNFQTPPGQLGIIPLATPVPGITNVNALVDTGAGQSCIDSSLAAQLNLPIVDRRAISGVHGPQEVNIHLAQVHVPSLNFVIYGAIAGVHLFAGGQIHGALIGRNFLKNYTMVYEGRTGTVIISN